MSNPREAALLKTEAYRQQIAQWVFDGILAYKRSQEMPADPARLKLAAASPGTNAGTAVATNSPVPKLEEVPGFRAKTNAAADSVRPAVASAKPVVKTKEPEVRKAEAVEPEVRRALPVEPRKGE
jgi:hypothetical protein